MIVYKQWINKKAGADFVWSCEGWFLFGFIPLYVRKFGFA